MLVEIFGVNAVESTKLRLHVGQEHGILNDMVQGRVGCIQDVGNILEDLLCLFLNSWVFGQGLVLWGIWNLAGNVDETYLLDLFDTGGSNCLSGWLIVICTYH